MAVDWNVVEIICGAISLILTLVGLFFALLSRSKNAKAKKIAEAGLSIVNYAQQGVKLAEQFSNFSGAEKKAYATTLIKQWCMSANVPYTDEQISEAIEGCVNLSKLVNQRQKDKEAQN